MTWPGVYRIAELWSRQRCEATGQPPRIKGCVDCTPCLALLWLEGQIEDIDWLPETSHLDLTVLAMDAEEVTAAEPQRNGPGVNARVKTMQGQGDATEFKQRGIYSACWINLNVYQHTYGAQEWVRYFHFDLNAGNGWNDRAGCMGSPLAFLAAADDTGCDRFFAAFVDEDAEACRILMERPEVAGEIERGRAAVFHGDNAAFITAIPDLMAAHGEKRPGMALGTVLSDPNGTGVPFESLLGLARTLGRVDQIINWNSTQWKRDRGAFGNRLRLEEAIAQMNAHKEHWLIREPQTSDIWQRCLVVARNKRIGEHRRLGFYHLESEQGQRILRRCSYSEKERNGQDQGTLW